MQHNCSSPAGPSMKIKASHLAAGICQAVFMNSVYHLDSELRHTAYGLVDSGQRAAGGKQDRDVQSACLFWCVAGLGLLLGIPGI